jgi:hypothetical protein
MLGKNYKVYVLIHRKKHESLLSEDESAKALTKAMMRFNHRKSSESKFGKIVYSLTLHEKIARITIPYDDNNVILISAEPDADFNKLMMKKIIPYLQRDDSK